MDHAWGPAVSAAAEVTVWGTDSTPVCPVGREWEEEKKYHLVSNGDQPVSFTGINDTSFRWSGNLKFFVRVCRDRASQPRWCGHAVYISSFPTFCK